MNNTEEYIGAPGSPSQEEEYNFDEGIKDYEPGKAHDLLKARVSEETGRLSAPVSVNSQNFEEGLRYNEGKDMYTIASAYATEGLIKVLNKALEKYPPNNWKKGMKWTKVLDSLNRHLSEILKGNDYDEESGLLHIDHIQCNAHFLSHYYKFFPYLDDRPKKFLEVPKIALDVDEVLADFIGAWNEYMGHTEVPEFWNFNPDLPKMINDLPKDFWSNIRPKVDPSSLPFEPHCYITSRPVDSQITEEWLLENGFPYAPVHTVGHNKSKVDLAKEQGVEIFVDDRYENFVELQKAGIFTFLLSAPHNLRYDVGHFRINSLSDLTWFQ